MHKRLRVNLFITITCVYITRQFNCARVLSYNSYFMNPLIVIFFTSLYETRKPVMVLIPPSRRGATGRPLCQAPTCFNTYITVYCTFIVCIPYSVLLLCYEGFDILYNEVAGNYKIGVFRNNKDRISVFRNTYFHFRQKNSYLRLSENMSMCRIQILIQGWN